MKTRIWRDDLERREKRAAEGIAASVATWEKRAKLLHRVEPVFLDWLSNMRAQPCPQHPEQFREIEPEATRRANDLWGAAQALGDGAELEQVRQTWKPVFGECPACKELKRRAGLHDLALALGVPEKYETAQLSALQYEMAECQANLEVCKRFAAAPRGFLILSGNYGTGKTHIGASILMARRAGYFTKHSMLLRNHRRTYHDSAAPNVCRRCMTAPLVVLDDVGKSDGGNDDAVLLFDINDGRYSAMLPTIMTTNLEPRALRDRLGDAIADRIEEAMHLYLKFDEPSRRAASNVIYLEAAAQEKHAGS